VGPNAYDDAGLVWAAWKAAGITLPRSSSLQYEAVPKVPGNELQPGDLLFYLNDNSVDHVAMYIGDGKIVHIAAPGQTVEVENLPSGDAVEVVGGRPWPTG
jgi:cell wall-associated NlpC family hydrolase